MLFCDFSFFFSMKGGHFCLNKLEQIQWKAINLIYVFVVALAALSNTLISAKKKRGSFLFLLFLSNPRLTDYSIQKLSLGFLKLSSLSHRCPIAISHSRKREPSDTLIPRKTSLINYCNLKSLRGSFKWKLNASFVQDKF